MVALLPAVAPTTLAIWKDVPYTLALLWVFGELLALACRGPAYLDRPAKAIGLGVALALVWLLRHNGPLTVLVVAVPLVMALRSRRGALAMLASAGLGLVLVVQLGLYGVFPVDRARLSAEPAIGGVAAVLRHHPNRFSEETLSRLQRVAPLGVWVREYDCRDVTRLAFHPAFERQRLRQDQTWFLGLALGNAAGSPLTVLGHHACAAAYLVDPWLPSETHLHRPPFEIPPNDLQITRRPLSESAHLITGAVFEWAEAPGRLWLTWNPALPLWAATLVYAGVAMRRRLRPLLWPGLLLAGQLLNTALTSLDPEFRYAFGVYLLSWLSLPLAWLMWRPGNARTSSRES